VEAAAADIKEALQKEIGELKQLILDLKRDQIKESKQEELQVE
jgi:hypothetical protein